MIEGVKLINHDKLCDSRGSFIKTYQKSSFNIGTIREEFYTHSHANVLRGFHYTVYGYKIVTCISGRVRDVIMCPKTGKSQELELTGSNPQSLIIPPGLGHAFYASEDSILLYKTTMEYMPANDCGFHYSAYDFGCIAPILSERDKNLPKIFDIVI